MLQIAKVLTQWQSAYSDKIEQIATMGFYQQYSISYTQFRFQRIQWWSAYSDKAMGFSARVESVVELQLSRNVIRVKTSIKNPKLSCD